MTYLVAYDGSPLAKSALLRAAEYGTAVDEAVHAVTVVPADGTLAREHGWLETDESFDRSVIADRVREDIHALVPDATVHCEFAEKHAARGRISRMIRGVAKAEQISVLFVGSEAAGHLVTRLASVGQSVAYGEYDLHITRRPHDDLV